MLLFGVTNVQGIWQFVGLIITPVTTGNLPATCTVGQIQFSSNATAGQNLYLCTAANTWTQASGSSYTFSSGLVNNSGTVNFTADPSMLYLKDDFPSVGNGYGNSEQQWNYGGTQNTVTPVAATANHPGVRAMVTGAVSGNTAYLDMANNQNGIGMFYALGTSSEFTGGWFSQNIVQLNNSAGVAAIASTGYCFGISGSGTYAGAGYNGVWICVDTTNPSISGCTWSTADWMYVVVGSSANTCHDSGVAVQSATWYDLLMASTTLGQVAFSVNGAASYTISSNVPNANSGFTSFSPYMQVVTRTTSAAVAWEDYWSFVGRGLSR